MSRLDLAPDKPLHLCESKEKVKVSQGDFESFPSKCIHCFRTWQVVQSSARASLHRVRHQLGEILNMDMTK